MRHSKLIDWLLDNDHLAIRLKRLLLLAIVAIWGYLGWLQYYGGAVSLPSFVGGGTFNVLYGECAAEYGLPTRPFGPAPISELNSNDLGVLLDCAVGTREPEFVKWVLSNAKTSFSVRKGGDLFARVAAWKDGEAAIDTLRLLADRAHGVRLGEDFNDIVAAARDVETIEVARYLTDGSPRLIKETNDQLLWGIGERLGGLSLAQHHASRGRIEVAEYFVQSGSTVAKPRAQFRHWVLKNNRAQLLNPRFDEFLVKHGVSRDEQDDNGLTVLHEAVLAGDHELVSALVMSGANQDTADKSGDTPLHSAIKRGDSKIALLLSRQTDVNASNQRGRTPLHEAFASRSWESASALLDRGAKSDIRDAEGRTAVYDCVAHGCPHLDRLVEIGADLGARDRNLNTLLHAVAGQESGGIEIARKVISGGAPLNAKNSSGDTALHLAASSGNEQMVRLLIGQGANANERNNDGSTPLHLSDASDVVIALLDGGANPDLANKAGARPVDGKIERTQMLFHSPSMIGARNDSIPKHFKSITAIVDEEAQGIELTTPTRGILRGLSLVGEDYESTAVTLTPRSASLDYSVLLACESWLAISIGDRGIDLVNHPILSGWEPLTPDESHPHTFRVMAKVERCKPDSKLADTLAAAASTAPAKVADQWAVATRLCNDRINSGQATDCELNMRPILKMLVKSGESWQEVGTIRGDTASR